jgi:hypothetical protein
MRHDPLKPRLRADASISRNLVKLLECWAGQAKTAQSAVVLEEASNVVRVLSNDLRRT